MKTKNMIIISLFFLLIGIAIFIFFSNTKLIDLIVPIKIPNIMRYVNLSTCGTYSTANTVYVLNTSLTSVGTCIIIGANNITIDCNGFSITGDNSTNSYGISASGRTTTGVTNCTFSNFTSAVYLTGSTGASINDTNATITYLTGHGIQFISNSNNFMVNRVRINVTSGTGIYISQTNGGSVRNAIVYAKNGGLGISFNFNTAYNNQIYDSSFTTTTGNAFYTFGAYKNTVLNSNFTSTTANTAYIYSKSYSNNLTNCILTSTSGNALYVYFNAYNNTFWGNTFLSNASIIVSSVYAWNNTYAKNKFVSSSIALSINQTLLNLDYQSGSNIIYWNNFTNTLSSYVVDVNNTNSFNLSVSGNQEGNIWENVMNGTVNISGTILSAYGNHLYIGDGGLDYPYNLTTSLGRLNSTGTDWAPLTTQLRAIADTCTYNGVGNWSITCTNGCNLTTNTDLASDGNSNWIFFSGTGNVNILANLSNVGGKIKDNGCNITVWNGLGGFS